MNLVKFSLLALLLAACDGGDSDPDGSLAIDAGTVIDSGTTTDGMAPDAAVTVSDAMLGTPDAALGVSPLCFDACGLLETCFGGGGEGGGGGGGNGCPTECTADIQDCSSAQLTEFEVCNAAPVGLKCVDFEACLDTIACIDP